MRSLQAQKALAKVQILSAKLNTEGATGAIAAALHKQESELVKMLSSPDVSYSRKHPSVENSPRPPPKSFTDFEKDRAPTPPTHLGPKSFVPGGGQPPKDGAPFRAATPEEEQDHQDRGFRQRVVYLENRITTLENQVEDLTDSITNPKAQLPGAAAQTTTAELVASIVRIAVIDGLMEPESALFVIARQLGLVDVTAKLSDLGMAKRAPQVRRAAKPAPVPEPADDDDDEVAAPVPAPPSKPGLAATRDASATERKGGRVAPPDEWPGRAKFLARLKKSGLTQTAVAEEAGLQQTSVSRYCRGSATSAENAKKLEDALAKLMG